MKKRYLSPFLTVALMVAALPGFSRPVGGSHGAVRGSLAFSGRSSFAVSSFPRQSAFVGPHHNLAFSPRFSPAFVPAHGFHQGFHQGFHHHHFGSPFFFSYSFGYPYYPYYPYDYSYPVNPYPYYSAPYYPNYYRPGYSPYTVYDLGGSTPAAPAAGPAGGGAGTASAPALTYYQIGHNWGQDLRQDIASWDQFRDFMKKSLANVSNAARDDFRRGFVDSYGTNGSAAFDKALDQAGLAVPPESK